MAFLRQLDLLPTNVVHLYASLFEDISAISSKRYDYNGNARVVVEPKLEKNGDDDEEEQQDDDVEALAPAADYRLLDPDYVPEFIALRMEMTSRCMTEVIDSVSMNARLTKVFATQRLADVLRAVEQGLTLTIGAPLSSIRVITPRALNVSSSYDGMSSSYVINIR